MFRKLYDWALRMAGHRHAIRYMGAVSFAESSFFPIPPDVMLVPMVLARRDQAYWIATVCTVTSVLGGMLGYAIGYFFWESVGVPVTNFLHIQAGVEGFRHNFEAWGAAIILLKGLTPIPFKLVTIASGLSGVNFPLFVLCAAVTRAARFFLLAWALKKWGEPVQAFIEKRLTLVSWIFLIALVGGFTAIALL
jgi:membrane protein YqaA with SNARE-associated domain